jgi:hypothetical protein
LSYCWGGPQQLITTRKTLKLNIEEIPFELFPKTIKDAMVVTRKLGIRYLWVDALCIIQDDDNDKRQEIDSMGEVYKNSTVTISAAKAKRVADGFLDLVVPWNICRLPFSIEDHGVGAVWITQKVRREAKATEPLLTRGWAFQELLLSPRVILFDDFQATWNCHTDEFRQLVPEYVNYSSHTIGLSTRDFSRIKLRRQQPDGLAMTWMTMVRQYSILDLTLFEDRLPALSGIVKELHSIWEDQYIAGFWKSSILQQLGWYRTRSPTGLMPFSHIDTSKRIGLPSWSWKSAPFPVSMGIWTHEKPEVATILHGYEIRLQSDQAPFGEVVEATLHLSGKLMEVPEHILARSRTFTWERAFQPPHLILDYASTKLDENSRLLLIVRASLSHTYCIIVQKQENNRYQRVGSYFYRDDWSFDQKWKSIKAEDFILE